MAKVKHGKNVKNKNDVQNVIIGIINRMQNSFDRQQIIDWTNYNLEGSNFYNDFDMIEKMVEGNLSFLYMKGFISCCNGKYSPQPIIGSYL